MNSLQLFISDQLVDLSDDSPMALTFQINNLAEVKNQQGNTSNQFKLPLTQRNRRILGFPDEVAFTDESPYLQYQAKIVQDGLEIIPHGFAELNSVDNNTASITVLSGNVDLFDTISGKIYEMGDSKTVYGASQPFKNFSHVWDLSNVVRSQRHTSGWIWPVIDHGNLIYDPGGQCVVDVRHLRPGFFVKTAIDLMLTSAGYKGTGSLLQDPMYNKLIVQFSNGSFEHGTDYQNQASPMGLHARLGSTLVHRHSQKSGDNYIHLFFRVAQDPAGQFADKHVFTAKQLGPVKITASFPYIAFNGKVSGDTPSVLKIYLKKNEGNIHEEIIDLSDPTEREGNTNGSNRRGTKHKKDVIISVETNLIVGDHIAFDIEFFGDRPSTLTMDGGATLVIEPINKEVIYGQSIQCERIFPDISQKDLLKDILQRFGIICQTDSNLRTINFASFRDIVGNIPIAKNWTKKCLDQGKSISFKLGGYAQVNELKYKEDENVLPAGFADARIIVADKTLPASGTLFESQFAPTLNREYIGGTIAQIKMTELTDPEHNFNIAVTPRLLIDQKIDMRDHNNASIRFTDGGSTPDVVVNDVISVPYFHKPDGEHSLCFGDVPGTNGMKPGLRTLYYPELEKILQQTKKVVRYFLLSPRDILELDLLIPVYLEQDSAYYYINKIDAWQKGKPTRVELVKLG